MNKRISSPKRMQDVIRKHQFTLKKSLGQNFLIDENILNNIATSASIDENSYVLEIGPGAGALTQVLAGRAKKVIAVEIDRRLEAVLADTLQDFDNVSIHFGDVLELDVAQILAQECPPGTSVTVVANLPYYVTTPILMKLLTGGLPIKTIVVMIQKEVASRLQADPGEKSYGSLSIAVQYLAEAKIVMTVPKTVFVPQPNVDSAVIRLDVRPQKKIRVDDEAFFFKVVRASFAQRRKTLLNNLMNNFWSKERKNDLLAAMETAQIDPRRRGETLSIEEFAALSSQLQKMKE
ncbi:16S rRNA (adenine(1518)-N(6)/adenine(1519)-N(6))-dimethyltransferase RsmA [Sporolactobacillus inulinus]|jgi:16S rRNA (adenine1518-N6/adenine1519-N6)-dimethyltransferase|uniref:Ribosomal RNA small subunit methyltransferase A n=2 Tax=Sporolactobacillus inulinus TaxID=2078 RepID=A0A4Y1ZH47_9BACL|nr:16S rRNA (adenine(1518)-N(6)/adenine(1519)-N(6))-dimethyltransferase RsmA [Sporolactobacillus inulinus]KLI01888.1 16S rRNA methyltransferase [Sporolactobacillus inulinus CASD]GAY78526.1 SSU rRNA (adenine(1518)-N(6)/adenine(1519)-N(6)) -dimethyltransferase [Sporolactobacillus inulinus]GEB78040.1 ribosomal RNA small subunit methyltransferase A [Sporolactobacillus inulinus]